MSNANHTDWYSNVFKAWQGKVLGSKPTAEMLQSIHGLGARPGKQALACAMALRSEGVTAGQIVIACGAPQLNKMRGFITDALLKRQAVAPSSEGHTVYKLELTAKGKARIERAEKAAAAAALAGAASVVAKAEKVKRKAKRAPGDAVAEGYKQADKAKAKRKALVEKAKVTETVTTEPTNPFEGAPLIENQPAT